MASIKRKPARSGKKGTPPARKPRARSQSPAVVVAEPPLRQGLLEVATVGAQAFLWLVMVAAIFAALAGTAFVVWSLRPTPEYVSDPIKVGSPFAVTFRIENTSTRFPLSHLKIRCLRTVPEASVDVEPSRIPDHLGPGEKATFSCPFRTTPDDPEVAARSELYFRAEYDAPVIGSFRLADNHGPYVLNTRLLPPRWTAKPGKD